MIPLPISMAGPAFDDLAIFNAAFEVRFDDAYLLWDKSGALWSEVAAAFPELTRQHAEPTRVVFASIGAAVERELTVEIGRMGFVEYNPDRQLKRFANAVDRFVEIVKSQLRPERYQRTGLRTIFRKEFTKAEEAAEQLLAMGFHQALVAPEKLFGVPGPSVQPELALRREDGKNGFAIRLRAETQKIELPPVPGWPGLGLPITKTRHWLVLDVDCYIQSAISADALSTEDWILQTAHVIKRDCAEVLNRL